eukprot:2779749-Rhodomonas_salina.2
MHPSPALCWSTAVQSSRSASVEESIAMSLNSQPLPPYLEESIAMSLNSQVPLPFLVDDTRSNLAARAMVLCEKGYGRTGADANLSLSDNDHRGSPVWKPMSFSPGRNDTPPTGRGWVPAGPR